MPVLLYDAQREAFKNSVRAISSFESCFQNISLCNRRGGNSIVLKFIQEETYYLQALDALVKNYLWRLKVFSELGDTLVHVDAAKVSDLFSNIEDIRDLTSSIVSDLDSLVDSNPSDCVSIVFDRYMDIFSVYSLYISNFPRAKDLALDLVTNCAFFKVFIHSNEIADGVSFNDLLELPLKRFNNYASKLSKQKDALSKTDNETIKRYEISLDRFIKEYQYVKSPSRDIRRRMKVAQLQEAQFDGNISLCSSSRYLLHSGPLQKLTRLPRLGKQKAKDFTFFLFNDVLLYAESFKKNKYKFKHSIGLFELCVSDAPSTAEFAFSLSGAGVQGSLITLIARSEADKRLWMSHLEKASQAFSKTQSCISNDHAAVEYRIQRKSASTYRSFELSNGEKWASVQTDVGVPFFFELGGGKSSLNIKSVPLEAEKYRKRIDMLRGRVCYVADCPKRALSMHLGTCIDHFSSFSRESLDYSGSFSLNSYYRTISSKMTSSRSHGLKSNPYRASSSSDGSCNQNETIGISDLDLTKYSRNPLRNIQFERHSFSSISLNHPAVSIAEDPMMRKEFTDFDEIPPPPPLCE